MASNEQNLSIEVPVQITPDDPQIASDDESPPSCVIDNGSATMKAGFGGHDAPHAVFPTIIQTEITQSTENQKYYIGDDDLPHTKILSSSHPIQSGIIQNFEEMEKIWKYTFEKELKCAPEKSNILMTESALNPKANRERTTQIMFETFNVPSFFVHMQEVLSLYANGRTTGVVMNCGHNITRIVPIYEGYAIPHAVVIQNFGGKDITQYLKKLILQKEEYSNLDISANDWEKMKKDYAYICKDGIENELKRASCSQPDWLISAYLRDIDGYNSLTDVEGICSQYIGDKSEFLRKKKKFKLPDGNVIDCTDEICQCVEMLFNPSLVGKKYEDEGIGKLLYSSMMKLSVSERRDMCYNVIMSGGTSLIKGYQDRMMKEITSYVPGSLRCKIIAPPEREYSAWIGGSILCSLSTFEQMWIRKEEYDETGPGIVNKKCF